MTYLAIPIKVESAGSAARLIEAAVAAGAELLELRVDYLAEPTVEAVQEVVRLGKSAGLPVLATCRAEWEGGAFAGREAARLALLAAAAEAGAAFVDLELLSEDRPDVGDARLIRSNHDFAQAPADLAERLGRLGAVEGIGKMAYTAETINDGFSALDFLYEQRQAGRDAIAMAMGEAGVITRLLAKKLGALLTFACLDEAAGTAAGQVSAAEMRRLYRWERITAETPTFGVIGCPVGHSMSPAIHNAAFDAVDGDGLYLPLLVASDWESFKDLLDNFRARPWLHMRGLSVTIPHKEHALRYVRESGGRLEPLAAKIGAVNTIVFDDDGGVSGYNTDYAGSLKAIMDGAKIDRSDLAGMRAAILGAGGVARALAAGLTDAGAKVTIYNRTFSKAEALAEEFGAVAAPLEALDGLDAKLVVNGTSLGMHPHTEATPLPAELLRADMIVFDTVYNPMQTRLLAEAEAGGATTVDGVAMFVQQAALQFELFTGLEAPVGAMREVVVERLTGH